MARAFAMKDSKRQGVSLENDADDVSNMAEILQDSMRNMLDDNVCTDFKVVIGENDFSCHKVVLAAVSDFFMAMFSSGMVETSKNEVTLQQIKPETFQSILDIIYHRDWEPDGEIMCDLLHAAGMLQMKFLENICIKYFKSNLSSKNCIEVWKMSRSLQCSTIEQDSWTFIMENFTALVKGQLLPTLDFEEIRSIIQDEKLSVENEEIACRAVLDWISFDIDNRLVHCSDLLQCCCLSQLTDRFLYEELCFHPYVRKDDACLMMIKDAVRYKFHPSSHGSLPLKYRQSWKMDQTIILLGKTSSKGSKSIIQTLSFISRMDKWLKLRPLQDVGEEFACCSHGDSIFVTGGTEGTLDTYEYIGKLDKWEKRQNMPFPLKRHTMSAIDGFLYVLGGRSNYTYNAQIIRYDIANDSWSLAGEMLAPVEQASSATLGHTILVFGGVLGDHAVPADCIQAVHTQTEASTILCHIPSPVSFSRALTIRNRAYVVTSLGEVLEIEENSADVKNLATIPNFNRKNFGLNFDVANTNKLLVTGGTEVEEKEDGENVSKTTDTDVPSDDEEEPTTLKHKFAGAKAKMKRFTGGDCPVKKKFFDEIITIDVITSEVSTKKWLPFVYEVHGCAHIVIPTPDNLN